jgi:tetrahydromethanopterin S-methyltransferase subunit C
MAAISFSMGQKHYPVPYPTRRIASYLALALSGYILSELLKENFDMSIPLRVAANTLIFIAYLLVIYKMEAEEIKPIWAQISKKFLKKGVSKNTEDSK